MRRATCRTAPQCLRSLRSPSRRRISPYRRPRCSSVIAMCPEKVHAPSVVPAGTPSLPWPAGERPAPDFRLTDEHGRAVSVSALRGRNLIITFADPHCTTFCPRESRVLNDALRAFAPAERPAVISVSVDPETRSLAVLQKEAKRFEWLPQWRWAAGSEKQLAQVWDAYDIAVVPTDDDINHTEAAYLVDRDGNERALFLWPFKAPAVVDALKKLS